MKSIIPLSSKIFERAINGREPYLNEKEKLTPLIICLRMGWVEYAQTECLERLGRPLTISELAIVEKNRILNLALGMDENGYDELDPFHDWELISMQINYLEDFFRKHFRIKRLKCNFKL